MIGYFYTCNAQRPNLSHLMQKILSDKTNADAEFTTQRLVRVSAARWDVLLWLHGDWIVQIKEICRVFLPECRQRCCLFSGSRSPGAHSFWSQCSCRPEGGAAQRSDDWLSWNATCLLSAAFSPSAFRSTKRCKCELCKDGDLCKEEFSFSVKSRAAYHTLIMSKTYNTLWSLSYCYTVLFLMISPFYKGLGFQF